MTAGDDIVARLAEDNCMNEQYDIIILGSGSTAFAAALRAEVHGARILMVERGEPGGTCVNWGCIPSKTLIHSALLRHEALLGQAVGVGTSLDLVDYSRLFEHRSEVVEFLRRTRYQDVLQGISGLDLVKGTGRLRDRQTVEVAGQQFRSERVLVATGGFPRVLRFPGIEEVDYLTSMSALLLKELPASLIIIGGGVIAMELGQMYHRLGCRVTILEHGAQILPAVEPELADALHRVLTDEGVKVVTGVSICSMGKAGDLSRVSAEVDGRRHEYTGERILLAVGTAPASAGIGLELAGVEVDEKGFVRVDQRMRTSAEGIWAAGDVTGGQMIASVGAREGIVAVDDMFTPDCGCRMDYHAVPMAIFTDPEIGMVGYGEEAARLAGFAVKVNVLPVSAIPKAHVAGQTSGVIKMVAEQDTGRLLGVHLLCHRGADLINEAALAVRYRLTVADLADSLHVYPSMAEGLRLCAQGFSRDISRLSCCAE